jgi:hypothetical protein
MTKDIDYHKIINFFDNLKVNHEIEEGQKKILKLALPTFRVWLDQYEDRLDKAEEEYRARVISTACHTGSSLPLKSNDPMRLDMTASLSSYDNDFAIESPFNQEDFKFLVVNHLRNCLVNAALPFNAAGITRRKIKRKVYRDFEKGQYNSSDVVTLLKESAKRHFMP